MNMMLGLVIIFLGFVVALIPIEHKAEHKCKCDDITIETPLRVYIEGVDKALTAHLKIQHGIDTNGPILEKTLKRLKE